MNILYIHGLNGSPHGEKFDTLRESFPSAQIIAPQHDSVPETVFGLLDEIASGLNPLNDMIVGSSLGGFWANFFSRRYGLRAVLINPLVSPKARLGSLGATFAADYAPYENQQCSRSYPPQIVLLAEDDEVLPYHEAVLYYSGIADVRIQRTGGHRMNEPKSLDLLRTAVGDIFRQTAAQIA